MLDLLESSKVPQPVPALYFPTDDFVPVAPLIHACIIATLAIVIILSQSVISLNKQAMGS